jgi:hypothetical protein
VITVARVLAREELLKQVAIQSFQIVAIMAETGLFIGSHRGDQAVEPFQRLANGNLQLLEPSGLLNSIDVRLIELLRTFLRLGMILVEQMRCPVKISIGNSFFNFVEFSGAELLHQLGFVNRIRFALKAGEKFGDIVAGDRGLKGKSRENDASKGAEVRGHGVTSFCSSIRE